MAEIFLSYASQDRERIRPLVAALEADGFEVWWDRHIQPGPSFDREIEQAIEASRCVVVAWSAHSVESEWVRSEVEEGARRGILIPLLLDDVLPPLAHRRRQAADLSAWNGGHDDEFEKLVAAIRLTLARDAAPDDVRSASAAARPARRARHRKLPGARAVAALSLALALGACLSWLALSSGDWLRASGPAEATAESDPIAPRFEIALPDGWLMATPRFNPLTITADGRYIVVNVQRGTEIAYLVRPLDALEAHLLPELPAVGSIWAAPEGSWIFYNEAGNSRVGRIRVPDGEHEVLAELSGPNARGADWSPRGVIAVGQWAQGIAGIDLETRAVEPLKSPGPGLWHAYPAWFDDGRKLIYVEFPAQQEAEGPRMLRVLDTTTGEDRALFRGSRPIVTASGHLIFTHQGSVWATAFDPARGVTYGDRVRLFEADFSGNDVAFTPTAVSANGTLVHFRPDGGRAGRAELGWLDLQGRFEPLPLPFDRLRTLRLSSDDSAIVLTRVRSLGNIEMWIYELGSSRTRRLNFSDRLALQPVWAGDDEQVVYMAGEPQEIESYELFMHGADGTGEPRRLTQGAGASAHFVAPDGRSVVFQTCADFGDCDLARVSTRGDEAAQSLVSGSAHFEHPVLSRDGRWLAYTSDETGTPQVYVRPYPEVDAGRWQVSLDGGQLPVWSRGDDRLFFVRPEDDVLMIAAYEAGDGFASAPPEPSIDLSSYQLVVANGGYRSFDVDLVGERLLVARPLPREDRLVVVLDWFEELERLAPTRR